MAEEHIVIISYECKPNELYIFICNIDLEEAGFEYWATEWKSFSLPFELSNCVRKASIACSSLTTSALKMLIISVTCQQ